MDPGESVTFAFITDCTTCAAPQVSCFNWTLFGEPLASPDPNACATGTATDLPNADKANPGGWTNNSGSTCAADSVSTICSSRIDEDIATPDDSSYIESPSNASGASVDFELTDAPPELQELEQLRVRFRASKAGGKTATVQVEVRKSDGTLLGSPTAEFLSATALSRSYDISGLSLTAADVDGLFVRVVGNVSGGGSPTTVRVQTINVEKTYFPTIPTPTPTPTPPPTPTPTPCPGDSDCDGWPNLSEIVIGTDPFDDCADTSTPDDEAVDKLPADLNDDQAINILDRARMVFQLLSLTYDQRFDLNAMAY